MSRRERVVESVLSRLPEKWAAELDLHRPSLAASWGWGPLNGQAGRQRLVRDLARVVNFDLVIETGTFRGNSTVFFAHATGLPVHSVEANPRYFHYATRRLAPYPDVTVELGDSRPFLRRLAERHASSTPLIYLDAHWEDDLPLREEVEIVAKSWERAVVIIDDFEVTGDPGYTFDDYGPGRRLCLDYLAGTPWPIYFPTLSSAEETGGRRGCAVIVAPSLVESVGTLSSLRPVVGHTV